MLFRPHTYNTIVEDEIGHSMADVQSSGVELAKYLSPDNNVIGGSGDIQRSGRLERLQVFEISTVGMGGGIIDPGLGIDGDKTEPLPNGESVESDGSFFANTLRELNIDMNAFDDDLFYDKTASFQHMMETFEFPELLDAVAFESTPATPETPRTFLSADWHREFQHNDFGAQQTETTTPYNLNPANSSQTPQYALSSTDDQENSQGSSPSSLSSTTNGHSPPILRPFSCDIHGCTRSYKRVHELRRHKKAHSGLKPYVCCYLRCVRSGNNGFARKDHLLQHLRQVHGQRR